MSSIVETIDTRLGTYNSHAFSNGNALPFTSYPFGMNAFALQTTDQNGNWWFNPYEPVYQGIRLSHQPSPWIGDFSQFLMTPIVDQLHGDSLFHRQSSYQLDTAIFQPDLLEITSNRYRLKTRLTPSLYGANMQVEAEKSPVSLTFYAPDQTSYTLLNKRQIQVKVTNASQVQSPDFALYISIAFDSDIRSCHLILNDKTLEIGQELSGSDLHFQVNFASKAISCQLATSFISFEQAQLNLERQADFTKTHQETKAIWNRLLGRLEIKDHKKAHEKSLAYHCLYRTLLFPQIFYELDAQSQPIHFDTQSHGPKAGKMFTNNGYWDTFRSSYPLYSLLYPDYLTEFLEGILQFYHDTHFLPKWLSPDERNVMPGTLVDGIIADACSKNIAPKLMPDLFEAMLANSQASDPAGLHGRAGNTSYQELGYLPAEFTESVSHSLDYAYSDWCIATVADALGKAEIAKEYFTKALSYRQLFDKETGYLRAKSAQGQFSDSFNPYTWGKDYAESSAIQATLGAYHDIEGIVTLLGGKKQFTDYLINLCNDQPNFQSDHYGFEIHEMSEMSQRSFGQLALSNQPSFHIPYLFHWSEKPEYCSLLIKQVRQELFDTSFQAFPGDEDNGSMASWYLFSCLGFYPVCPGTGKYQLGIPQFTELILHLPSGNEIQITCQNNQNHYYFVDSVQLDQKAITELKHQDLMKSSKLTFRLSLLPKSN
ncbi:GH92 family glycosyl hydrolase [Streptococcus uberis]|nr:GH92 family glycosyl hydrolase [Streptococcus uberis]